MKNEFKKASRTESFGSMDYTEKFHQTVWEVFKKQKVVFTTFLEAAANEYINLRSPWGKEAKKKIESYDRQIRKLEKEMNKLNGLALALEKKLQKSPVQKNNKSKEGR